MEARTEHPCSVKVDARGHRRLCDSEHSGHPAVAPTDLLRRTDPGSVRARQPASVRPPSSTAVSAPLPRAPRRAEHGSSAPGPRATEPWAPSATPRPFMAVPPRFVARAHPQRGWRLIDVPFAGCRAQVPTGNPDEMHTQALADAEPGRSAQGGRSRSFATAITSAGRAIQMSPKGSSAPGTSGRSLMRNAIVPRRRRRRRPWSLSIAWPRSD